MRWDIDKALAKVGGLQVVQMRDFWVLTVTHENALRTFEGRTIREAYLRARRALLTRSGKPRCPVKKKPKATAA